MSADGAPSNTRKAGFRPEIEGLRAIAATLVAVFHIWFHRVSGGVDVFFVVASFLITSGLVSQVERGGSIELARVWGRLIKRLVPAAFLVLCAIIVAALFLLPKSRWRETIGEVAASAAYVENWLLAAKSVDYLAQHAATSPLQHFWALSVQGQFYLFWPLLILFAAFVARQLRARFRSVLLIMLGVLFAASLAFSVYLTWKNQPLAYFNTAARAWEFCIGAMLAVVLPLLRVPAGARVVAGWLGVAAIISCGIVLQVSRVFPGYAALWPTLGAVLVIVAGTTGSRFGVDRILGSKPMVFLGGISYGIYLWHFPLLCFAQVLADPGEISFLTGLLILVASVALAYATNRIVENPARTAAEGRRSIWAAYGLGAAWAAPVVIGLLGWSYLYVRAQQQERVRSVIGEADYPGAAAMAPGFRYAGAPEVRIYPGPLAVAEDRERLTGKACNQRDDETMPLPCVLGDPQGQFEIAVVGGSHAAQWLPALEDIAKQTGWRIVSFTRSNCPFYSGVDSVGDREIRSCAEWNRNVLAEILRRQPAAVFTTATRFSAGRESLPDSYLAAWKIITASGIKVLALRDNPAFGFDVSACVELHGADARQCSKERAEVYAEPALLQSLTDVPPNLFFMDLSDYFCTPVTCVPVAGNVMIYRHRSHITATYARTLAPMLKRELLDRLGIQPAAN